MTLQSLSKDYQAVVKADDLKERIAYWSDNDKFIQLGQMLYEWSRAIGVKEPILKEDMDKIVAMIKLEFSDFTAVEVNLAFRKGVAGKLKLNFEHYQEFNIWYVSKILQAYREFRKEAMAARHKAQQNANRLISMETVPKTREEKNLELYQGLDQIAAREKRLPIGWNWISVYDYMEEHGLISLTREEKEIWRDNVIEMIKEEIEEVRSLGNIKEARKIEKILKTETVYQGQKEFTIYTEELRHKCRVEYVKHYFRNKYGII